MKLEYDSKADAIYILLKDVAVASTREVDDNLIVDLDARGKIVGIEFLFVSDDLSPEDVDNFTLKTLRASS